MIPAQKDPERVMKRLKEENSLLSTKNDELADLYEKQASANRDYLIAFAQTITTLRIDGETVSLARDLAKGNKMVAELKYKADIAEGVLNTCREKIKDLRRLHSSKCLFDLN